MRELLIAAVVLASGCKSREDKARDELAATCGAIDHRGVEHLMSRELRARVKDAKRLAPTLRAAVVESCTTNRWRPDALVCTDDGCADKLTAGQRAHAEMLLAEVVRNQAGNPIEPPRPDPKDIIGSPLPDVGPDPSYPTPKRAGTQNLFTMEDPERGPKAPIDFKLPPRSSLTWTNHAHCEDDKLGPVCGSPLGDEIWSWRVGRDGKGLVVAEQLRGKTIEKTYVYTADATGSPLERIEFDGYGRVTGALLFVEGNRYTGRERTGANALEGCGFMKYKLDADRHIEELVCEQWLGGTMLDTNGVARTRFARDARGFVTEARAFGLDAKPTTDKDGVSVYLYQLDRDGRRSVTRHRDKADVPVAATSGCFGRRFELDRQGTPSRTVCLNAGDFPINDQAGVAVVAYKSDGQGCRIGTRNLADDDAPAVDHYGSHGDILVTDAHCAIKQRTCVDLAGKPARCRPGEAARSVFRLDSFGRVVSARYYDAEGHPAGDSEYHAFEIRTKHDDLDLDLEETCWNDHGAAADCDTTGFHRRQTRYDDVGRAIEERYFDEAGKPVQNYHASMRRYRYDNYDHLFEATAHDFDGTLVEAAGIATRRDLFDSAHRLFGVLLLDKAGKPALYNGCYTGAQCTLKEWHAVRILRRPDGSAEKNLFFDAGGQVIDTLDCATAQCWDTR